MVCAMNRNLCVGVVLTLMLASGSYSDAGWQRNTFPGQGHFDNGYRPGWGWDHVENIRRPFGFSN